MANDFILTISDDEDVGAQSTSSRPRGQMTDHIQYGVKRRRVTHPPKSARPRSALDAEKHTSGDEAASDNLADDDDVSMDSGFEFKVADPYSGSGFGDVEDDFDLNDATTDGSLVNGHQVNALISARTNGDKKGVDIDALIANRRKQAVKEEEEESASDLSIEEDETIGPDGFGMGANVDFGGDSEASEVLLEDEDNGNEEDGESSVDDAMPEPEDLMNDDAMSDASSRSEEDATEQARRKEFFAPEEEAKPNGHKTASVYNSFQEFSLSRPILRGLTSVGFTKPTPIQKKTIPVALLGKDVVGGAVTGSGKTAAFVIPILERLLYRPKSVPTSRVAILMPTRELAVQCFNVARKLAAFTDITFCQLVGGFSLREQEAVLRTRPDILIATPGRFIDHMRNSATFTIDTLEILVLDEADRMLEDGFSDELNEILTTIPKSRQTMLFSATMTNSVDKLVRVGLQKPVRLMVDAKRQTVGTLVQEFVRLRPGREHLRMSYLLHLCQRVFVDRVIVFFRQKKEAHRARVIFALLDIKAAELHGSMSQEQRISAINAFTSGKSTHLLATDLASRGLDIPSVATVINFEAPQSHEIYLHRVGRTARAGRSGRSCTLAAESDRKVVKQVVKASRASKDGSPKAKIFSRTVEPLSLIDKINNQIEAMQSEIEDVLRLEKEEKLLNQQDMQIRRGENLVEHEDEIKARPKRTWFESEKDKQRAKRLGAAELNGSKGDVAVAKLLARKKQQMGKGKLSGKDKKDLDDRRERAEGRMWKKDRNNASKPHVKDKSKKKGGMSKANGVTKNRKRR